MSDASTARPVVDNPHSDIVLVGTVPTDSGRQRETAEAVVAHWQSSAWPPELLSLTAYTSSDGESVLTYAQWSSQEALHTSLADRGGISDTAAAAAGAETPVPFRLYRAVRGSAVADPAPVAESFPVAFFAADNQQAAREWVDNLLAGEEASEGDDRDYPGGISANMHISVDGTSILSFSEWVTEANAVAHIEAVWEPVLKELGGTGLLYRHFRSLFPAA
ncbi:hypothetical protein GA0115240_107126 [Streptomyces sp. DvalAA-14]|uniref:hypothetical protein n=1 Tax=unclassified Streptomyces TaxID=2593676 RepID=UPI00081B1576|nr:MULTISPECIES: hypothetical protein [unclassified Streptomyces]MYS19330.1 hypothetical protein [Streptomyces sp. SID4948]SCD41956.1 hypothetical protein GA0115240_107126 [Streptomyces sp. DvalAA-14]